MVISYSCHFKDLIPLMNPNFMSYAHNEKEVISKQDDEFLDQFQPNFMSFNHYMGPYIVEYVNMLLIWSLMI
jgi:hypothetical protein